MVRRVQNRRFLGQIISNRTDLEERRGKDKVELTLQSAWHGSGKTCPDEIAAGMQVIPAHSELPHIVPVHPSLSSTPLPPRPLLSQPLYLALY